MQKIFRLILFVALAASGLPARQEQAVCGTHRDKWQETVYLHGRAEQKRLARKLENRATLERQTAAYFTGLPTKAAAEETDLEDALSTASQEMDFDQP